MEKVIRGTTPTIIVETDIDVSLIADLRISFAQDDKQVVCKSKDDCTLDGFTISVTLTQEETLKFDCKKPLEIQARAISLGGEVAASDVMQIAVMKCHNNEVLCVGT